MVLILTVRGTLKCSCSLVSTTATGLITPSAVQNCASTHFKAAAQPGYGVVFKSPPNGYGVVLTGGGLGLGVVGNGTLVSGLPAPSGTWFGCSTSGFRTLMRIMFESGTWGGRYALFTEVGEGCGGGR